VPLRIGTLTSRLSGCSRDGWDFRIGNDRHSMSTGDIAVIPGDTEREGFFPEDTEVVNVFSPPREDFLAWGDTLLHGYTVNPC
jgi:hypothetical protein